MWGGRREAGLKGLPPLPCLPVFLFRDLTYSTLSKAKGCGEASDRLSLRVSPLFLAYLFLFLKFSVVFRMRGSGGGSHGRRWRNAPARQGGFTRVLRSSAFRARANSGGPVKPLWRAGVFSPWTHGPLPSPIQKGLLFKAGPGGAGSGSVTILAQGVLPQGWRAGYPPARRFTASGGGICCSNSLAPGFGQGAARFGAKKYGPPISGQAWGAIHPLVVRAAGALAPGRASCSQPIGWPE